MAVPRRRETCSADFAIGLPFNGSRRYELKKFEGMLAAEQYLHKEFLYFQHLQCRCSSYLAALVKSHSGKHVIVCHWTHNKIKLKSSVATLFSIMHDEIEPCLIRRRELQHIELILRLFKIELVFVKSGLPLHTAADKSLTRKVFRLLKIGGRIEARSEIKVGGTIDDAGMIDYLSRGVIEAHRTPALCKREHELPFCSLLSPYAKKPFENERL